MISILACGGGHTMVVTSHGTVMAFGRNNRGQLGVGDMEHHGKPSLVPKLCGKEIVQVECGSKHTIVLTRAVRHQTNPPMPSAPAFSGHEKGEKGLLANPRRGRSAAFVVVLCLRICC